MTHGDVISVEAIRRALAALTAADAFASGPRVAVYRDRMYRIDGPDVEPIEIDPETGAVLRPLGAPAGRLDPCAR